MKGTSEKRPKGQPAVYRDEMGLQKKILSALGHEGKTVPELAGELSMPSEEVMMYLMAMRRYGLVEELPKERRDRFFKYAPKGSSVS